MKRIQRRSLGYLQTLAAVSLLASFAGSACEEKVGSNHEPKESVGPWDFPDAPNPDPIPTSGAPVPDPPLLLKARGNAATFKSGIRVELVALSRNMWGPEAVDRRVDERSWNPNGSPFSEVLFDFSGQPFSRATDHENKGARYLAFRITSPANLRVDIFGYIPDFARQGTPKPELHGRDIPMPVDLYSTGPITYRFPVVVDDRSATRYLFALASGEWKKVAAVSSFPAKPIDTTLAIGSFGKLTMELPPKPGMGIYDLGKRTLPVLTFRLGSGQEPPINVYRLVFFDKAGKELGHRNYYSRTGEGDFALHEYDKLGRIEVLARPYEWAEFTDVHYDPDPKKWDFGYWLSDGAPATIKAGDVSLEGILRPEMEGSAWIKSEFFAPDGKAWREYPGDHRRPRYSGANWPSGEIMAGVLKLSPEVSAANENVVVKVFESKGDRPGKGLGPEVATPFRNKFDRDINHAVFVRPNSPFVQFEVRRSEGDWKTVASVPPTTDPLVQYTPEQLQQIENGVSVGVNAFAVILRKDGTMDFFYHRPDQSNVMPRGLAKWDPDGVERRLMVRLKSGGRREIQSNGASSDGSAYYDFRLGPGSEPVLESFGTRVRLKDVAAFELETRAYGKPQYLVAKLPQARVAVSPVR